MTQLFLCKPLSLSVYFNAIAVALHVTSHNKGGIKGSPAWFICGYQLLGDQSVTARQVPRHEAPVRCYPATRLDSIR